MPPAPTLALADPDATRRLGRALGETARRGDCLLLSGELGAGKTSLAKGLAEGLAVADPVTSPTFSLLAEYRGRLAFFHVDLYRLTAPEIASMGLADYWLEPRGVTAIEWPERMQTRGAEDLLPEEALALRLDHAGEGRVASFDPQGARGAAWLAEALALAARD